ncbi:MAG: putative Ig domain-containing protein, partial [Terriglobales bacterium]
VLSVSGGNSPYQFSVVSGALPPGVSLNSTTGSITGQPTAAGNYTFVVGVTDKPNFGAGTHSYSVAIRNHGYGGGITVSVSPSSVTLSSGGNQQFTATVTGTANTAVTWLATAGSIGSNGLYAAPVVNSTSSATITATSQAEPSQSASAAVTINPSQQQSSVQIATLSLPIGQQGEFYFASFSATGGTQPYTWSMTGGNLPQGISLSAIGELSGTPTAVGSSSFTVLVTDATGKTATGTFGLTVVASNGYDGPAQLPLKTVASAMSQTPAPGSLISVNASGNLQSALNSAACGDVIQLQAGATFSGNFTLPAKNCTDSDWIIIRTSSPDSALPAEGQRVTPCYAGVSSLEGRPAYNCQNPQDVLAKVEMVKTGNGPFQIANGANFYRFVGLEITRTNGLRGNGALITLLGTADHIIVDRSWLHGNTQDETNDGFAMSGGTYIAVVDSYFSDFHCIADKGSCTDAHAVSAGVSDTQDGPYKIEDNFLEASGEGVMFGGGPATMTPTDIEIVGNHFWKPWQWMPGNPQFVGGPEGNPFIVKNHMELKNAVRVLAEANLMDNVWGGFSQTGFGVLLTPKNQHTRSGKNVCDICEVTDVTFRYNQISHAGGGMQLATSISGNGQGGAPAKAGTRWSIHDVVMDDLSTNYVGGGSAFEIVNGWPKNPLNTVTVNHITAFPDSGSHVTTMGNDAGNESMYALVFTNNLVLTGRYPVWNALGGGRGSCASKDVPLTSITNCFTTYTFQNNGLIATPPQFPPSDWPSANFFPASPAAVQFVNYNNGNGGDYELLPNSPYKGKGTDGKDLGADINGLDAALAGVQ